MSAVAIIAADAAKLRTLIGQPVHWNLYMHARLQGGSLFIHDLVEVRGVQRSMTRQGTRHETTWAYGPIKASTPLELVAKMEAAAAVPAP